MKIDRRLCLGLVALLMACGLVGCQTSGNSTISGLSGNIKPQGVYTTIALDDPGLEMPGSSYLQKSTFAPGETPAAVIVGYGNYNQQQLLSLEVLELSTGRTLFTKEYYASYGKALMQPLSIRLSGDYKARLLGAGREWDCCQFTVARTNRAGMTLAATTESGASYGQGTFDIELDSRNLQDYFAKYNDKLIYTMVNAVGKDAGENHRELFAQRYPGKVVLQFHLDFNGRLSEPVILENNLDAECGEVIEKALLARSPYEVWPEETRQQLGSDSRRLTLTVHFN